MNLVMIVKLCLVAATSHYVDQWWLIINWTLRNKFRYNCKTFLLINVFENVVCKVVANLFRPPCVLMGRRGIDRWWWESCLLLAPTGTIQAHVLSRHWDFNEWSILNTESESESQWKSIYSVDLQWDDIQLHICTLYHKWEILQERMQRIFFNRKWMMSLYRWLSARLQIYIYIYIYIAFSLLYYHHYHNYNSHVQM